MKNFRRTSMLITIIIIIAGLLAGCGSSGASNKSSATSASSNAGNTTSSTAQTKASASNQKVTISLLSGNTPDIISTSHALIKAFEAKYPNITVRYDIGPAGSQLDNFVKTRLATGDMDDVFFYNAGSLMQALNPSKNLVNLANEPFMKNVLPTFKQTVTQDGKVYGAPVGASMVGGFFYNKKIYQNLGLSVPKTWDQFIANSEKIKAAGITPVIGSFKDDWTAQIVLLADYYNVQTQDPSFPQDYTANKAKYLTTPVALRSFEKLSEIHAKGLINKDFLATTYNAALKMLAEGKGAQYPMLTVAIPAIQQNYPDKLKDLGYFGIPGNNANDNGLTVWMPMSAYIAKNTQHLDAAKKFEAFVASKEGVSVIGKAAAPSGPYMIKGAGLPDNAPQIVKDMLPYFQDNKTAPALEFLSPLKGPNLPQISVEVGSGLVTAKKGAALYDNDVKKAAVQLGLKGW